MVSVNLYSSKSFEPAAWAIAARLRRSGYDWRHQPRALITPALVVDGERDALPPASLVRSSPRHPAAKQLIPRRSFGAVRSRLPLLLALIPLSASVRAPHVGGRTSVESGGGIDSAFAPHGVAMAPSVAAARRRLAERANGTYIREILVERDSTLPRWPGRVAAPLTVWIQPTSRVTGWSESYVAQVRDAFREWDALRLPVRFLFTHDSAAADVHVAFVDHFDEEISGRTRWARDDGWWITNADIDLAVFHRDGPRLDDDAMRAMSLHEIGHLLGLDHTTDRTSIMAPKVRVRSLSPADRATVRLLYALPPGGIR